MSQRISADNTSHMHVSLEKLLSKIEGVQLLDINIINRLGETALSSFFESHEYLFVVYQNGLVCDPCSEFIFDNWENRKKELSKLVYPDFIIIGESVDRKTQIFYQQFNNLSNYFIDKEKTLRKNIIKSDFPVNFIFYIDKNFRIIYASYFSYDSKEEFNVFFDKGNRFAHSNKTLM